MPNSGQIVPGSFRDPAGFIFLQDGFFYRQINQSGAADYELLMNSGLASALTREGLLVAHQDSDAESPRPEIAYKIIKPEKLPFISYPYEWSFSQLKDAALTTLAIQKRALSFGLSLKDSSAYNIQFNNGEPLLIDTLSFEKYQEGMPWVAYRQFCQHFLAPLALIAYTDSRLSLLLRIYLEGIPLDLAVSLLPWRTRFTPLFLHLHLHARCQKQFSQRPFVLPTGKITRFSLQGILDSLESCIRGLVWKARHSEWVDYYQESNYSPVSLEDKKRIVSEFLKRIKPSTLWDLGANTGLFSRIASAQGIRTVSFDSDPLVVEKNYLAAKAGKEKGVLHLVSDLTNPSPGIGWENKERLSLIERGPTDAVLALALIHHLAISHNLPFEKIAIFFNRICRFLIIEFVPKEDSQVQRLLAARKDIFPDYTQPVFEREFGKLFRIEGCVQIQGSERKLYLLTKKE